MQIMTYSYRHDTAFARRLQLMPPCILYCLCWFHIAVCAHDKCDHKRCNAWHEFDTSSKSCVTFVWVCSWRVRDAHTSLKSARKFCLYATIKSIWNGRWCLLILWNWAEFRENCFHTYDFILCQCGMPMFMVTEPQRMYAKCKWVWFWCFLLHLQKNKCEPLYAQQYGHVNKTWNMIVVRSTRINVWQ